MRSFANEYTDPDQALDDVRVTLNKWANQTSTEGQGQNTVRYTLLVLQEWIANLQRHADFSGRSPLIRIGLAVENQHAYGVVVDNSEGFPLDPHLPPNVEPLDDFPEGQMGLRIIDACTQVLSYASTEDGLYRFEFSIPSDLDPCLNMPF